MKQFLVRSKASLLMLLAATLLFATGMTARAQNVGDQNVSELFGGTIPNPTSLSQDIITVLQTPAPFDPGEASITEDAFVGPMTDGYMAMRYTGIDGKNYDAAYQIRIDNTTDAITVSINGTSYPVSSLADVFSVLPEAPAPVPANFEAGFDQPIALAVAGGAQVAPKGPFYVTDWVNILNPKQYVQVYTQPWGGRAGAQNPTQADCIKAINAATPGLYALLLKTGTVIQANGSYSYDCHGFTFTSTDNLGTNAQWMTGDQVQFKILDPFFGNGYTQIPANQVQKGDIAIYWGKSGKKVAHSGRVIDVVGAVITIRSKWGPDGLYDHPPNVVPAIYGAPKYYHSNRAGGNVLNTVP